MQSHYPPAFRVFGVYLTKHCAQTGRACVNCQFRVPCLVEVRDTIRDSLFEFFKCLLFHLPPFPLGLVAN